MVFEVALKLRENDEDSRRIMHVLASCTMLDGVRTLGGGGGYLHGRPEAEDDYLVVLCFQKNDNATGNLVDVTEPDRDQVRKVLSSHQNVSDFLVGPILADGSPDYEPELVRRFKAGERG